MVILTAYGHFHKSKGFGMLNMIVAKIHRNKHLAPHNIQCTSFQSSSTSSPPIIPITMLIRLGITSPDSTSPATGAS